MNSRKCKLCGKWFLIKYGDEEYCSNKCRKQVLQKKCKYCGNLFYPHHRNEEYCSSKCRSYATHEDKAKYQRKRRKKINNNELISNENEKLGTGFLGSHKLPTDLEEYKTIQKEMKRLGLK